MKISIDTATGKLYEAQSHGDDAVMIDNAARAGVTVEVREIPDSELHAWIDSANPVEKHNSEIIAQIAALDFKRIRPLAEGDTVFLQTLNDQIALLRAQLVKV